MKQSITNKEGLSENQSLIYAALDSSVCYPDNNTRLTLLFVCPLPQFSTV